MIYVPYKQTTAKVVISPTKSTTFDAHRRLFLEPPGGRGFRSSGGGEGPPVNTKPGLNLAFLHQFLSLLSIMIPRLTSKESFLLLMHTFFLVSRTYVSPLPTHARVVHTAESGLTDRQLPEFSGCKAGW